MIKKVVIVSICFLIVLTGFSQEHMPNRANTYTDDVPETGFRKENLFLGGSLSLGFDGYDFNVGGSPEIGWSLNRFFDVGLLVNLNYASERADPNFNYNPNTRYRTFNYGAGAFARIYPLPFFFLTVQPEYNVIEFNSKDMTPGSTVYNSNMTVNANSFLVGAGYGQRVVGHVNFYVAILFDALDNQYSPYRDPYTHAALPVFRAGFDIYLHQH